MGLGGTMMLLTPGQAGESGLVLPLWLLGCVTSSLYGFLVICRVTLETSRK